MSFANFDEIRKICCEYEEDLAVRIHPVEHLELFPEGHMLEERMKYYIPVFERENHPPVPRLIPDHEEEAVYMVRYGELV